MAQAWDPAEALKEFDSPQAQSKPSPNSNSGGLDYLLKLATGKDLSNAPMLDPLAQGARLGQFANQGNQQLADLMAEGSGYVGARMNNAGIPGGQNVEKMGLAAAGTLGTASEFLIPQNRLGVASYAVAPAMKAYKYLFPGETSSTPGFIAQAAQARSKVSARDAQAAINDPAIWDAPPVSEANAAYAKAAPGVNVTRSLEQKTGKALLSEADYDKVINESSKLLQDPSKLTPQDALDGIQSINRYLRNREFTMKLDKGQFITLNELKDNLYTHLENNGSPGMRAAAGLVRKAHINENLRNILPVNKYGGTDALRTMWAGSEIAGALGGLAAGSVPFAAVPVATHALSASPAVWGGAIRNYQAISNPAIAGTASTTLGTALPNWLQSDGESEVGPQSGR